MAYTKIHAIKATVNKAVDYICNPDKTDEKILIYSFGCSPKTAAYDFKFSLSKTRQSDPNLAYHLIQSFSPGETTYAEAHQIGLEMAERLLKGKYSYIVSTHVDRGHLHNHIIFCAADNIDHQKYNDCKSSYRRIRQLSDELCVEHGLSVIEPQNHGQHYKEWQARQNGKSWKANQEKALKRDIDIIIKWSTSYEDFLSKMRQKGYEIEGDELEDSRLKTIKFKAGDWERFVRGSERTLGQEYTRERIAKRIEEAAGNRAALRSKRRAEAVTNPHVRDTLIDTHQERFASNAGLKRWAELQNLKTAASIYANAGSLDALEANIGLAKEEITTTKTNIRSLESSMRELGEIIHYIEQFEENRTFQYRYEKSKDPERYYQNHTKELTLFGGADNILKRMGVDPKSVNLTQLKADYEAISVERTAALRTYKDGQKKLREMEKKRATIEQYLNKSSIEKGTER